MIAKQRTIVLRIQTSIPTNASLLKQEQFIAKQGQLGG
jgi:hypothetical protein